MSKKNSNFAAEFEKITYVRFMKRRRNNAGNRRGVQMVTLCISTTMVLVLLGMVVFSVLTSHGDGERGQTAV